MIQIRSGEPCEVTIRGRLLLLFFYWMFVSIGERFSVRADSDVRTLYTDVLNVDSTTQANK